MRSLGIASLEDKIVQRAVSEVMSAIYEENFIGLSYGYRPGHGQHDELNKLTVGILRKKMNWVLDLDISRNFDTIDHDWMAKFLEHRIGDKRLLGIVQHWLRAGVMEGAELEI